MENCCRSYKIRKTTLRISVANLLTMPCLFTKTIRSKEPRMDYSQSHVVTSWIFKNPTTKGHGKKKIPNQGQQTKGKKGFKASRYLDYG